MYCMWLRSCFRNNDSRSSWNSPLGCNAKHQLSTACSKVVLHIRKQYFAASIAMECKRMKYDLRMNHLKPNANYICATNFNTQKTLHFAHTVYLCVLCDLHNKQQIPVFLENAWRVDICYGDAVCYLRYELNVYILFT